MRRVTRQRHHHSDVVVSFPCARCGRPIVLVSGGLGAVLPDREQFVETHRRCLAAIAPVE